MRSRRSIGTFGSALVGAVLLGFGTIFQGKARPDDHWSTSPKVHLVDEADQGSGDPPT